MQGDTNRKMFYGYYASLRLSIQQLFLLRFEWVFYSFFLIKNFLIFSTFKSFNNLDLS